MLTEKTGMLRKIFETRIHRMPSIKCFKKPENFISCIKVAEFGLFLPMKISRIYETGKKNMRFGVKNV